MTAPLPPAPPADEIQPWQPKLYGKQNVIFNFGTASQQVGRPNVPWCGLASGSRESLKTIGCIHRMVRHLWETPMAKVAMVAKWMNKLTDMGSFVALTERVMPEWINADIGMKYTTFDRGGEGGARRSGQSRSIFFRVTNMYGNESELRLFSFNNENEVVDKLKGHEFTMVYITELTTFSNPELVNSAIWQLRANHVPPSARMFLADTNPGEDGEDNWVYRMFFLKEFKGKAEQVEKMKKFFDHLQVMQLFMRDNPLMNQEEKDFKEGMAASDPGVFDRDILGLWTKGHGTSGKHFADVYSVGEVVIGGGEGEKDTIEVGAKTDELFTGSDLGDVNHAIVLLEKLVASVNGHDIALWVAHDELESIGESLQLVELTHLWQAKMREIEDRAKRKFEWTHWSDDSAIVRRRSTGQGTDALEVLVASGNEIQLMGVDKPDGSVIGRVRMLRRLLREKRIFVAARCKGIQRMLENCKRGSNKKEYVAWDMNKHIFDALTYPIYAETGEDLLDEAFRPSATEDTGSTSASVALNPYL